MKASNKYVWNWLANVFSKLFLFYKLEIVWLKREKNEKPQVHFRTPLLPKKKKWNILFMYNLLKGYKIDQCELCLNSTKCI